MKLRPFELTLVIVFGVMAIVALVIVKGWTPDPKDDPLGLASIGSVTIWGTLPAEGVNRAIYELYEQNESYTGAVYRYYRPDQIGDALINALADGYGPDMLLVSHEKLVELRKRILPVSYESLPLPDMQNLYLDGVQIFALSDGLYGYPIAVDPLMMYWNRDILTTEGYLEAPRTWEMLINTMFPKLIDRDFDRTINRSVVAMGEYGNVRNAFGIVSALFIQGGSGRVIETNGKYYVQLRSVPGGSGDPLQSAADFFTRFSRPANTLYSWNRALPEDRQQFIAGDLVFYFGYGSEGPQIERLNPNLNFGISEIPQGETATVRRTYGKFYSLSILKTSDNMFGSSAFLGALGSPAFADRIAVYSSMVPVNRAAVNLGSNDIYGRTTYKSASVALGWLNPNLTATEQYVETMTKDINENRRSLPDAVRDFVARLGSQY